MLIVRKLEYILKISPMHLSLVSNIQLLYLYAEGNENFGRMNAVIYYNFHMGGREALEGNGGSFQ